MLIQETGWDIQRINSGWIFNTSLKTTPGILLIGLFILTCSSAGESPAQLQQDPPQPRD
jgi:hypothetical protein